MITVTMPNSGFVAPKKVFELPMGFFVGKLGSEAVEHLYFLSSAEVFQMSTVGKEAVAYSRTCDVMTYRPVDVDIIVKEKGL